MADTEKEETEDLLTAIRGAVEGFQQNLQEFEPSGAIPAVVKEVENILGNDASIEEILKSVTRRQPKTLRKDQVVSTPGVRG